MALTEMWLDGKIKYYNYFGSYYIDPLMIFVPQMVFIGAGIPKASYNVLGKWEEDHGGRDKISPKGSYYYLAEAIEAAGFWGIILVSTGFAVICAKMEKLRAGNIFNRFIYYSFFGAFGFGFVKAQFSWCARYFIQNIFTLALFFLMYKVFYDVAKNVRDQSNGKISGQTIV
ncbi:hypothetical protein HZC34_08015 [Candidatus Saganbacteria bacterium]|nr:hypothetical protein [Candidatus Saganbacteria bacterium]